MNLNGKGEAELYQEFYGNPLQQMPLLIEGGYKPLSITGAIGRRESAPADVVDGWRKNSVFTGDGIAYDERKNTKLVLDAALLHKISSDTKLDNYAMVLFNDQWEELRGDDVLSLNADKIAQANHNGFVKRKGVWQPENMVVGDIWNHLSRGKNLKEYAEMVNEASGGKRVMLLRFDIHYYDSPVMRSLVLNRIDLDSDVNGYYSLNINIGRLVGVALEAPEIANPGVKVSTYRGYISTLEKKVEEVTEEPEIKKPLRQKIADAWGRIFAR